MTIEDTLSIDAVLTAFDEYLRRVRGVSPEARRNYARYAQSFLSARFDKRPVDFSRVSVSDVVSFVTDACWRPDYLTTAVANTAAFIADVVASAANLADAMSSCCQSRTASKRPWR